MSATFPIIRQGWLEHEIGWGYRPDDDSLHLTMADRDAFVSEYKQKHPYRGGDYIDADLRPKIIEVNALTYQVLRKQRDGLLENTHSRYGIWIFKHTDYEPADWFCDRMKWQGFDPKDFGKKHLAKPDPKKYAQAQAEFMATQIANAFS